MTACDRNATIDAHDLTPERREGNSATYCLEDDKIRLYVGRVERSTYDKLRTAGFQATPKQDCDFAAVWSVSREEIALSLIPDYDDIGDEATSPTERAADRAERFEGYRSNRLNDATRDADRFEAGPSAYGMQSQAKAEKLAARRDRIGGRAVSNWDKAEYWSNRTAGVISNALYRASAHVRRGRIKQLESDLRKIEQSRADSAARYDKWVAIRDMEGADVLLPLSEDGYADRTQMNPAQLLAYATANDGSSMCGFPRDEAEANAKYLEVHSYYSRASFSPYDLLTDETFINLPVRRLTPREVAIKYLHHIGDPRREGTGTARYINHLKNRLAYENAMLENEGGFAGNVEMIAGGFFDGRQIQKVNKSNASGRITSVEVWGYGERYNTATRSYDKFERLVKLNLERAGEGHYRAPTEDELKAFNVSKKEAKASKTPVSTINPTEEDAQRFQKYLNARAAKMENQYSRKPNEVYVTTQAKYSYFSKGGGMFKIRSYTVGDVTFKLRTSTALLGADGVVILTDKPRKPIPIDWALIESLTPTAEAVSV